MRCRAPGMAVFEPAVEPARSGRGARAPGDDAGAGAGADPYGRMLVSPFTFYRGAAVIMADDLAATPRSGLTRAVLRRRAPGELRCVRLAGAAAGVRHQRLRRDAARAVGVGRQAAGGEPGDRRRATTASRAKDQERIVLATVAAYRTAMREFAGMTQPRRLVRALDAETAAQGATAAQFEAQGASSRPRSTLAKARTKDSMRRSRSSRTWSTASRGSSTIRR